MDAAHDRIISMTELQKLSLRKLREMRLDEAPLVVRDMKRRRSRFVILDHRAYERLVEGDAGGTTPVPGLDDVDFADMGLFWDRPTMTNERFAHILRKRDHAEHRWAWARSLERLPSRLITRSISLADLRRVLTEVKLRSRIGDAWRNAIEFWTEEARRRLG